MSIYNKLLAVIRHTAAPQRYFAKCSSQNIRYCKNCLTMCNARHNALFNTYNTGF